MFTVRQAASELGVTTARVYQLLVACEIEAAKIGYPYAVRMLSSEQLEMLRARQVANSIYRHSNS
jgi:hypothetical protein